MESPFVYYEEVERKMHKIEYLTGLDVDQIILRLAAGYTLEPPKQRLPLIDLYHRLND